MATAGEKLLSAVRRTKSKSALYDIPEAYFSPAELTGFHWLRDFVETHNKWPEAATFKLETGLPPLIVKEPVAYYLDDCRKRALWQASLDPFKQMREAMANKEIDEFIGFCKMVVSMSHTIGSQREGLTTLSESLQFVQDDYDIARKTIGIRGIPTGFPFLDESTDGWQNANLYSFVARTGVGKTFMLLALALAAHRAGYSVLFLTMEMGVLQVARRFFGLMSGINPKFLRQGKLSSHVQKEMQAQIEGYQAEGGAPFYWMAGNFKKTVDALHVAVHEVEPDIVFADASYLLKRSDRNKFNSKHELLADVQEGLSNITVSANRPLIQSIQFNRTAVKSKKGGDEEADKKNPIAHLDLTKIGGTDSVAWNSAGVYGLSEGDAPFERTKRYCGTLKGREGETGWFEYSYEFQPVRLIQLRDHTSVTSGPVGDAPDMSFMQG